MDETLKLTIAGDSIWSLDKMGEPVCTNQSLESYLAGPAVDRAQRIRVVGKRCNAALIVRLHELKKSGRIASVEIATPLVCQSAEQRRRPEALLRCMLDFHAAPSQGGYHELTDDEVLSYRLAAHLFDNIQRNVDPVDDEALDMLHRHIAWKSVSFIPSINHAPVAGLISFVLDPRWFIDTCNPDRTSKLEQALGLNPTAQRLVTGRQEPLTAKYCALCRMVMSCWKSTTLEPTIRQLFRVYEPRPIANDPRPGLSPGDFPWRIWGSKMKFLADGMPTSDPAIADLRASQRFIQFVHRTWIDAIYRNSSALPEKKAGLFRPADFFKYQEEIDAYMEHMRLRGG